MQLSTKQLLDLISLSFQAVMQERDDTFTNSNPEDSRFYLHSPVAAEVNEILGGNSWDIAETINSHLSAIRLGMQLRNKNN